MKTTLVVGAGATFADHKHSGYKSNRPPLDRNFFWYYREIAENGVISHVRLFNKIEDYFKKYYGHSIRQKDSPYNSLEYVLRVLYVDAHVPAGADAAEKLLLGLIEHLNYVISRSTNAITLNMRSKIVRLIDLALTKSDGRLSVISFNYDLQVERALLVLSNRKNYGNLLVFPACYCLPENSYKFSKPKEKDADVFPVRHDNNPLKILKPHGSLNWWRVMPPGRSISHYYPREADRFYISKRAMLPLDLTYRGNKTIPLLIPPLINKGIVLKSSVIGNIWREMSTEITSSEKMIIYGYSMSDSDSEARSMFSHALKDGANINSIEVINPDVSVGHKFFGMHHVKVGSIFRDVNNYISYYSSRNLTTG